MSDVAQGGPGTHRADPAEHRLAGHVDQAPGEHRGLADEEHLAGVAVIAVLDDGDVDIDDVALLQALVAGDAVTDLVVHRGADRLGEAPVVQRCRDRLLDARDVVVADRVELVGGHAGRHVGPDHVQHVRGEPAGNAHALDGLG
jgi:hypothetical protein